jgi:HK97 family phage major capsid protein
MKELLTKLELKKAEARQALEAGDLEKGRALKAECEVIASTLEELKSINAISVTMPEPVRPPLPGQGLNTIAADDSVKIEPAVGESPALKAAYVKRFGEPDALIKSWLTELHGTDYVGKYFEQRIAFQRYLRGGEQALRAEDRNALRQIVYTPNAIQAAWNQDIWDTSVLKSTMVEASDELGGYLVPVDFQARIIERLMGFTVVRPRATVLSTSRDAVQIPKATGGDGQYTSAVRVTWVDETPTAGTAESNLTFGMENIPIHTAMIETPLSRNLLEDAVFPLEPYLAGKFAEAAAIDEDNRFLTGDGVGKPQGILPGSANSLTLEYDNSGHATTLTWDGLIAVPYSVDSQYRARGAWIAEKATYEIIRKLQNGVGDYYWQPDQQKGQPLMLLGFPVLEQEAMPSVGASAYPIIFGDLSGYYIADRVGMSVERYLDSATARQNLVYFVMRRRLGGQCAEPWRFAVQYVSA